jgi:hypothetical protein
MVAEKVLGGGHIALREPWSVFRGFGGTRAGLLTMRRTPDCSGLTDVLLWSGNGVLQ